MILNRFSRDSTERKWQRRQLHALRMPQRLKISVPFLLMALLSFCHMFILQHNTQQDPEQLRQIPSAPKTASKRLSKQCDDQWFCKGYSGSQSWILDKNFDFGHSRNNDCRVIDDKELVNVLGRYNRNIDTFNLETGKYNSSHTRGKDPAGQVLSDLNHVYGVQVESLELPGVQELWLPCGFHGDKVNKEISSSYARILNLADKTIRLGPALPIAGGACSALGLEIEGPGTPKHICTFGGTLGSHDSGKFLPNCTCYDRVRQSWSALPALPYGLDHSNAILHHAGTCPSSSARASETANLVNSVRDNIGAHPARILVTNFRTVNYGKGSSFYGPGQSQILALDVPGLGTAPVDLAALHKGPGWYVFADPGAAVASVLPHSMQEMLETEGAEKGKGQEMKGGMGGPKGSKSVDGKRELGAWVNIGRDAAGMVSAGGSRYIISLGGVTAYEYQTRSKESWDAAWKDVGVAHSIPQGGEGTMNVILDQVRMMDLCHPDTGWNLIGHMKKPSFAIQSCPTSSDLNIIFTCGGQTLKTNPRAGREYEYRRECEASNLTTMLSATPQFQGDFPRLDPR